MQSALERAEALEAPHLTCAPSALKLFLLPAVRGKKDRGFKRRLKKLIWKED